jgi:hypothetical protein
MEALKYGLNEDTLRKARTFADENNGYTVAEVDELCSSIRTCWDNFSENGAAIGRTHILRLINVPKARGQRASVQAKLFENGWSTAALESEIRRRFGRRKRGGRRAAIGTNLQELFGHLDVQCEAWLRLDGQLSRRQEAGEKPSFKDLPDCAPYGMLSVFRRGIGGGIRLLE